MVAPTRDSSTLAGWRRQDQYQTGSSLCASFGSASNTFVTSDNLRRSKPVNLILVLGDDGNFDETHYPGYRRPEFNARLRDFGLRAPAYIVEHSQCMADRAVTTSGQSYQNNHIHSNFGWDVRGTTIPKKPNIDDLIYKWAFDDGVNCGHCGKSFNGSEGVLKYPDTAAWNTINPWHIKGLRWEYVGSYGQQPHYDWQTTERVYPYGNDTTPTTEVVFPVRATVGQSTDPALKHSADYCRNKSVSILQAMCADHTAYDRQFMLFAWPNVPHDPVGAADQPPILSPDTLNRTTRLAKYDFVDKHVGWIPPVYDWYGYTDEDGTRHEVTGLTTAATNATTLADTSATFTSALVGKRVFIFGVAWANVTAFVDSHTLTIDRWRTWVTNTTDTFSGANKPTDGTRYGVGTAKPSIDLSDNKVNTSLRDADNFYTGVGTASTWIELRNRMRCTVALDDIVVALWDEVIAQGKQDCTYIVFTTDNGWFQGEHNIFTGKESYYPDSLRCDFYIAGPGLPIGVESQMQIGNLDLAPTICDILGITPSHAFDGGVSILDYINNETGLDHRAVPNTFSTATAPGAVTKKYVYGATDGTYTRPLFDLDVDPWCFDDQHANGAYAAALASMQAAATTLDGCIGGTCSVTV